MSNDTKEIKQLYVNKKLIINNISSKCIVILFIK